MYTIDEIRRIMEPEEETPKIGFIEDMKPDRQAAAMRYYLVEDILYDWHGKLNDRRMNTREIPEELKELYDQACHIMMKIARYEHKLSE